MATDRVSKYLEHLPAVLQEGPFIGPFLLAFEAVLHGLPGPIDNEELPVGLSDRLDRMSTYFDPLGQPNAPETRMPAEFLPWLAQWMATSLWDDWSEPTKRNFLANCISLYRQRGTRLGLETLLRLCVTDAVAVVEFEAPNTQVPAHYFQVNLTISENDADVLARQARMVQAIVDREKPVHTFYGLSIRYPAMRINNNTTDPKLGVRVGQTTILGNTPTTA